jgi:O-antigen/teichoic acid export membrane protein
MRGGVGRDLRRGALAGTGSLAAGILAAVISVPIVLHGLGSSLYGVWVVANVVVFSQGLLDFGAVPAMTRYVAIAAPRGDRALIHRVVRLSAGLYATISIGVLLITVALVGPLVDALGVDPAQWDDAKLLLISGGVAFGVSNAQAVMVGFLTGLNRAATAYKAVAVGYFVYIAVIALGALTGHTLLAVLVSAPLLYGSQFAIMVAPARSAMRRLPDPSESPQHTRLRELVSFGLGMQTAAIADFFAVQLPRLIGALAFGTAAIVGVDVAMRTASIVSGILLMTQTAVLPALARAWVDAPASEYVALARRTFSLMSLGGTILFLGLVVALAPALQLWVGDIGDIGQIEAAALGIAAAFIAHSVTSPLTAAAQVRGEVRQIVYFKVGMLLAVAVGLFVAARFDVTVLMWVTAAAVFLPSVLFCWFELKGPLHSDESFGIKLGQLAPFVLATAVGWVLRQVLPWGELASLLVALAPFAVAAAWVLWRSPPGISLRLGGREALGI